jgi:hypothetical protein
MFVPTGDYPNVTLPDLKLPRLNRLTHILSEKMTWWGSRLGLEYIRRRAGLVKPDGQPWNYPFRLGTNA